jgi:hypothetical protein
MFCPSCGVQQQQDAKYCAACGASIQPQELNAPASIVDTSDTSNEASGSTTTEYSDLVKYGGIGSLVGLGYWIVSQLSGPLPTVVIDPEEVALIKIASCKRENGLVYCDLTNLRRDRRYNSGDFGYETVDSKGVIQDKRSWITTGSIGPGETIRVQFVADNAKEIRVGSLRGK